MTLLTTLGGGFGDGASPTVFQGGNGMVRMMMLGVGLLPALILLAGFA